MAPSSGNGHYYSNNYHKHTTGNWLYQWHLRVFHRSLFELLKQAEPTTVLDAGCGEGFVIAFLRQQDPQIQYTGVDRSEKAIAFAQEHFGEQARFRVGDIYKLPFSDNSFDAVVCSEVLEHLEDPDRAVVELKRVARRAVLITVPLEPYFRLLNSVGRALGCSPDPGHVNFWTKRSFQDFIRMHFEEPTFDWKHIFQLSLAEV